MAVACTCDFFPPAIITRIVSANLLGSADETRNFARVSSSIIATLDFPSQIHIVPSTYYNK